MHRSSKNPRLLRQPLRLMSLEQLRSALIRAIVLEYQNGRVKAFPRWGWEKPTSMLVLRRARQRAAAAYLERFGAVSSLLFERRLPMGKEWPGTTRLVPAPMFAWREGVWTHIGCSVPLKHVARTSRGA
jgi:hypothetical protein